MTTVLLIHGINNQGNSKENIEKEWIEALRNGAAKGNLSIPNKVKFIAAFYGDVLHSETEIWSKNQSVSRPMSVESPDEDFVNDEVAALYFEYQQKYDISDKQVASELDADDNFKTHRRMAKGIHKAWLKAIARCLENILPSKGKRIARKFLTQAAAYLHKPGLKERVDDLVKNQTFDKLSKDENVIIISHSLGTIIAYTLLRRLRHQINAKLLLTAGSPLGIKIVKRRLGPPLCCLPNVDKWVNVSDREDFVALQPKLTSATFGCDQIINIDHINNGNEDAHDILKYLSQTEVVQEIVHSL